AGLIAARKRADEANCVGHHDPISLVRQPDALVLARQKIEAAEGLPGTAVVLLAPGDLVAVDVVGRVGGAIRAAAPAGKDLVLARILAWERPEDAGRAITRNAEQVIGAEEAARGGRGAPFTFDLDYAV